jgi:hypothetical protein
MDWPYPDARQIVFSVIVAIVCLALLWMFGPEWWHFKRWDHKTKSYNGKP